MVIQGKSLELIRRALQSHLAVCAQNVVRSDEKTQKEWDTEFEATTKLINDVMLKIDREDIESTSVLAGE